MSRLPATKRREQLLDTAADLFASLGYAGATTSQIARAAGVSEPIIYRHFASKRDLFIALIERTGERTVKIWEHELRNATEPAEQLMRLIRANPMVSSKGRALYRVIIQAMTEVQDDKIREAIVTHMRTLHAFLRDAIERVQQAGAVSKRFTPDITAWALIEVGIGYGVVAALNIDDHARDAKGVTLLDMLGQLMLGPENYPPASD